MIPEHKIQAAALSKLISGENIILKFDKLSDVQRIQFVGWDSLMPELPACLPVYCVVTLHLEEMYSRCCVQSIQAISQGVSIVFRFSEDPAEVPQTCS